MTVYGVLATLGVALLAVIAIASAFYFAPGPAARQSHMTTVVLRAHAGTPEIAADLAQAGAIGSDPLFVFFAEITGQAHRLKAGEYQFRSHASLADVISEIVAGRVVRHFITVPEGETSEMVMQTLERADFLTGFVVAPPEGSVLPETYEARRGDERSAVLLRMTQARDRVLDELWAHRRPDLPYKSPEDAVILASIVEKETAKPDERPRIAAVFVNRLQKNMRLESDPTVIYGLTGGRPLGHPIRESELQSDTPYNTYKIGGLPPTPIANPGEASLAAALDPPHTDELYFVADGTGGHVFSSTLQQHQQNVARWRVIEARRACMQAAHAAGKAPQC
jgi:UPF0755 protein